MLLCIKLSLPIKSRIDYIFHSSDLKCITASVIKESAGDHYPILAVFDL
jgi:endonuclease/exonuclease/phosphatase (EEP) superfamily protein YafD